MSASCRCTDLFAAIPPELLPCWAIGLGTQGWHISLSILHTSSWDFSTSDQPELNNATPQTHQSSPSLQNNKLLVDVDAIERHEECPQMISMSKTWNLTTNPESFSDLFVDGTMRLLVKQRI
jgi:hypothetical protein